MRVKRKKLFWLAWAVGIILALMLVLTIVGSWYINSAHAQTTIRAIIAEKLGDGVRFQRVGLSLFFRPHIVFHQMDIALPGVTTGSIQSLNIYPQLRLLLTGSFRIARLRASSPNFVIDLPKQTDHVPEEEISFSDVKKDIASTLSSIRSFSPDLVIEVKDGRLALRKNDRDAYTGRNIRGRAALLPNGFEIKAWIDPDRLGPSFIQGRFIVEGNHIAARDVQATILDSTLTSSVEIIHAAKRLRLVDISLDGTIGRKTVQLASTIFSLPPEQTMRSPLTLSNARLILKSESDFTLSGTVSITKGPSITLESHRNPDELFIQRLLVKDEESMATITLRHTKNKLDFAFRGSLSENTLNRMFERSSFERGRIQGDLQAHVQLDRIQESTALGIIEGAQFIIPIGRKVPLKVEHISLRAANKTIMVNSAAFSWGNTRAYLKGSVKAQESGFFVDADLSAENIKVEDIQHALAADKENEYGVQEKEQPEWPQLFGTIRFNSKSISFGQYSAAPFRANLVLDQQAGVHVSIIDAAICGISLPGNLTKIEKEFQLDFKPTSLQQPLEPTLACLWGAENRRITGTFDLQAHLLAKEKSEALVRALQGWVSFSAKNGEIYQYPVLARVFAAINVSGMVQGKFPDMSKEGFAYNSITIKGSMRDGKLLLKEAAIDGVTANLAGQGEIDFAGKKIDITLLVAPFKTVDMIVKNIPLVNSMLANTLITIPVKVKGDLGDPAVTILSPTAIGEGVLGIMKRTLQLPFTVIKPILPNDNKLEH
jgi:hypothetical protein